MKRLIQFFINRPVWGNAVIVIVLMFGLFSLFTTNRSFFPENTPKTVVVSVTYPGASPSEMETGVTIKIEQAIKGLDGIEEINSTSSENFSQVIVTAYEDTDMDELYNDIDNAVSSINSFPKGTEPPTVTRPKTEGMGSVVSIVGISSRDKDGDITELTDMAAQVERDLLNTREISQIAKQGFPEKEISVNVREEDLLRFNISMTEIANVIGTKNIDITTGTIRGSLEEMNVRSNNRRTNPMEIENILLRTSSTGESIRIGDVADVELTYSEVSQESKYNGRPSVSFRIEKTPEQDIAVITEKLREYKNKFEEKYADYEFNILFEFNSMLDDRIDLLTRNGVMGLILVLLFLGLFLNIKLSAWVAFGIPFSFLGMFIFGSMYGITINMISLFGMILVVGILVDDGIVIAENIYTHFEKGKKAHKAALDGTIEVLQPVFTSVVTTIIAFSILLFVEGMEMIREMAFVVISCLAFSLLEAFIILPGHLGHKSVLSEEKKHSMNALQGGVVMVGAIALIYLGVWLIPQEASFGMLLLPFGIIIAGAALFLVGFTKSPIESKVRSGADNTIRYIRDNWFKETVHNMIGTKRKWFYLSFFFPLAFTVLGIGLLAKGVVNFTFFPNIAPDFFTIEAAYTPGDSKAKTEEFIQMAEQILMEENQRIITETGDTMVTSYTSNLGASQSIGQVGNHTGMVQVYFDGENAKYPVDTLMKRINRRLQQSPVGLIANSTYVGGHNRFGKEIAVGLTSPDEDKLLAAKEDFKQRISKIAGVINVKDNMPPGKNEVQITLRPEASIYGLSESEVLNQIRQGFFGAEAQRVIIGTDEVKIWVRYSKEDRNSYNNLINMKIKTMQGTAIPLKQICDFEMGRAPETLRRIDGQRIITVDAESTDPDLVANINAQIEDSVLEVMYNLYPDLSSVELGQVKRMKKIRKSILPLLLGGVILMFIVITLHFNSLSSAFLIMLVIPSGLGGAIIGHGLIGIPLSILSFFGIVALIGVLVNDAIVFLDRYNDLLLEGESVKSAAFNAAASRFRPILLTSLTTVAGLLPIITEKSMQAQFLIPVAASIAFGVLFGTLFILIFYPSAILFWNGIRVGYRRIIAGERVEDRRNVEPIIKLHQNQHEFETK